MTNNELVVKIPHRLTQQQAVERISKGIDMLKTRFSAQASAVDTRWEGDQLVGSVTVMNTSISGTVDVEAHEVIVTLRLPLLLAMLKDKISGFVTNKGTKLLEQK